jgi:DNA-binding MarR family transcriptional regulator
MATLREKITKQLEKGRLTDGDGKVVRTLAQRTHADPGAVSACLTGMAKAGLIERQSDSRGTYAVWLVPSTNGQKAVDGEALITGIINAVAKLKAENADLTQQVDRLQELHQAAQKTVTKLRAELDEKQLEIAAAHRQVESAQREAAAKATASDQIAKLREMLDM